MILNEIFAQLEAEAAKGAALPTPIVPAIEEELKPFILRPMTQDELHLMAARDAAQIAAERMVAKVILLQQMGLLEDATPQEIQRDEEIKFKASLLRDLFFWLLQANTGWEFASLYQRTHEGQVVVIGLPINEAREFYMKQQQEKALADMAEMQAPGPRLVN